MFTKIGGVFALAGMVGLSLFLLNCGSSSSRPAGTVYVLTQGSNGYGDNVTSFSLDLNSGNLSLVNSNASTCPAAASPSNPEPCGIPLDILLDPAGANAFVLNQGTPCTTSGILCQPSSSTLLPSIYSYSVNSDGSLSSPSSTGTTWTSGGDTAIAMVRDAAGQFLFVIDEGIYTDQANCPMFGSSDSIYTGCPSISVFGIQGSTLMLESGSPFYLSKVPTSLSPVTFVPGATVCTSSTSAELLFVTGNHDLLPQHVDNTVSVFCVSSSGVLSPQPNSPYAIAAVDPVSVQAVNTNEGGQVTNGGVFVYVGNNGPTGDVSPFQVCTVVSAPNCLASTNAVPNSLMFPITTCPTSCILGAGQNPTQMIVDPTNNFLYAMSQGSSQVYGFRINTTAGTLTPLSPPNLPTGSQPISMALHPTVQNTGQFLFTSNSGSSNLTGFTLNAATGSMVNPITVVAPAAPSGIAVH
jgi:hypothetical protein